MLTLSTATFECHREPSERKTQLWSSLPSGTALKLHLIVATPTDQ